MIRKERAIAILKDAERDFRLKPEESLNNNLGLCWYFSAHRLCKNITLESLDAIYTTVGIRSKYYLFTNLHDQAYAWRSKRKGYNSERADFCRDKIKELQP